MPSQDTQSTRGEMEQILDRFKYPEKYLPKIYDYAAREKKKQEIVDEALASLQQLQQREVEKRVKLIENKYKGLEHGIFAVMFYLDKPYPDDPRWTPYSRFIHPKMIMIRKAIEGEDVGEMWAMQESKRINDIHASMKNPGFTGR